MALTAALVHGFGPNYLSDIWNPFVPLLPFTLAVFLLYDAACGRKRALVEATVAASFAMQSHLAFVILTGLLLVWGVAWAFFWPKVVPAEVGDEDDPQALAGDGIGPPRPTWTGLEAADPAQRGHRHRAVDRADLRRAVRSPQPAADRPLVRLDRGALRLPVGPQPGRSLRAS